MSQSVFLELSRFLGAHRDTYGALLVDGGAFAKSLAQTMVELNLGTLRTRDELHGPLTSPRSSSRAESSPCSAGGCGQNRRPCPPMNSRRR